MLLSKINKTNQTRISLDFRVIPTSKLPSKPTYTVTMKRPFAIGGYYSKIDNTLLDALKLSPNTLKPSNLISSAWLVK